MGTAGRNPLGAGSKGGAAIELRAYSNASAIPQRSWFAVTVLALGKTGRREGLRHGLEQREAFDLLIARILARAQQQAHLARSVDRPYSAVAFRRHRFAGKGREKEDRGRRGASSGRETERLDGTIDGIRDRIPLRVPGLSTSRRFGRSATLLQAAACFLILRRFERAGWSRSSGVLLASML